jgi:uncharacterized damage-inducible protein DinB
MKQEFQMFAAYNSWANRAIYDAGAALSDDEFTRDTGVFFHSLCGTLNHILVADRIWLKRFTGRGEAPSALNTIIHPNFAPLRIARENEDKRIADWINGLDEAGFAGRFNYTTVTDMRTISQRLAPALYHFFNHQTHHRGQASAVLTMLGRPAPNLDLISFQRSEGRAFA